MIEILINTLPIYITIFLGYYFKSRKIVPDNALSTISTITFKIVAPFLIFHVLYGLEIDSKNMWLILIPALLAPILIGFFATVGKVLNWSRATTGAVVMTSMCFAIGSFAYPFIRQNFSEEQFANVVISDVTIFFLFFTVGYAVSVYYGSSKNSNPKEVVIENLVKSPLIWSMVLAVGLTALNIQVPDFVFNITEFISKAFGFLAVLMLGLALTIPNKEMIKRVIFIYFSRLILVLGFAILISKLLNLPEIQSTALILCFTAPFCSFPIIFSEQNKLDTEIVSQLGLFSFTISLIIYPLVIYFLL